MKYLFTVFLTFYVFLLFGQKVEQEEEFQYELRRIEADLRNTISPNWFIEISEASIRLTYCRTCQEAYMAQVDSVEKEYYRKKDEGQFVGHYKGEPFYKIRNKTFKRIGPDSVSFYGTISQCYNCINSESARKLYAPEDILQIKIEFEKEWSQEKIENVQKRNDVLKKEFLRTPLLKTVVNFDDYRGFIPSLYHKKRIKRHNYYFKLLPYKSKTYKYSIFLRLNKKEITTATLLVDRGDKDYFAKTKNYIEKERVQTLLLISYVLQLEDYKVIN